ncbi:hypothetical protein [Bacillus sp. FJAT-29814]|uniref:hypothetical protein n=1 Tax=Bacillus sp. FJAT-29814 TaxID=1729688 RepID=UPI00082E9924|nr:hypothetical protein [Bacillus sp. FJAT-29814]
MANSFDERIKQALESETVFSSKDTTEMWNIIEGELFEKETTRTRRKPAKQKRGKKRIVLFLAVAASLLIAFGTQTSTGSAMIDKVKSMFAPEKDVTTKIEGSDEETKLNLHEGKKAKYVLYVDEARYQFVTTETSDKVVLKEALPEKYPTVEMEIKQLENKEPGAAIEEVKTILAKEYDEILRTEEVSYPMKATLVTAKGKGTEWNTPLAKVYVMGNGGSGSFVITQTLFLEAEEGHGARFDEMLKEFHTVE